MNRFLLQAKNLKELTKKYYKNCLTNRTESNKKKRSHQSPQRNLGERGSSYTSDSCSKTGTETVVILKRSDRY